MITPEKTAKTGSLKELTSEEKLQDFEYLYATLKDSFPFFEIEKDKTGFDWLGNKNNFEEQIKSAENNEEFYNDINKIAAMIQNGHTGVVPPSHYDNMAKGYSGIINLPWGQILNQNGVKEKYEGWKTIVNESMEVLPVKFRYIEGKYVVTEGFKNIKKGCILKTIEDKPIDTYFKDNMDKYYLNYDYNRDKLYVKSGMIIAEEDKNYKIAAYTKEGEKITEDITPAKYEKNKSAQAADSSSEEKILKKNKIAYLKVKSMSNMTLDSDGKKISEFFNKIKDYPYLIIDIRGNGGGTDEYWMSNVVEPLIADSKSASQAIAFKGNYIKPFLTGRGITTKSIDKIPEQFKSNYVSNMERYTAVTRTIKPKNSVNFKGKIYLLVDDYVYSSAESFAAFSKSSGFAELVGTTTGGDGIGIDPCVMALPNSGLIIRFSLDMGINSDGTVNEKTHTKPDIYTEQSYADFLKGEDTILNKVLQLCNK
ncbi:MAG: peptidase S41 [Bacillota bacterium]|nr:peptidase S41 [Bacillota bacterium]